jgi:hypothetical protein
MIPAMKFEAMSWKAKPSARPRTPTPARSEVTVRSRSRTLSAISSPTRKMARVTVLLRSELMTSLCPTRWSPRRSSLPIGRDAIVNTITMTIASKMFGSIRMKVPPQPLSFS